MSVMVTISVPDHIVRKLTNPASERDTTLAAHFVAGAVLVELENESPEDETCEHGLSAWLCAGPAHYPADM